MYKIIGCIVIYDNEISEIKDLIKEFYKEDINQKLVIVDNSEISKIKDQILEINKDIDYIKTEKNVGYGAANNIAIRKYENASDYFIVMNPDIFVKLSDLKKLIKFADEKKEFGIIMPKIVFPDGTNQYLCKLLPTPKNLFARRFLKYFKFIWKMMDKMNDNFEYKFTDYNKIMKVPYLSGCFMFCHYEKLIKENGFDERYFMYLEDTDLSRRMFKYINYFYPDVEVVHTFCKASYKSTKMTKLHIKSAISYFNKWGWIFDRERDDINKRMINENMKGR